MEQTFKQYADSKQISVQAVYQCYKRHRHEMEGMTIKKDRALLLNDRGIAFMDECRKRQIVEVVDDERTAALRAEYETAIAELKRKITETEADRDNAAAETDAMRNENRILRGQNTRLTEQALSLSDRVMALTETVLQLQTAKPTQEAQAAPEPAEDPQKDEAPERVSLTDRIRKFFGID